MRTKDLRKVGRECFRTLVGCTMTRWKVHKDGSTGRVGSRIVNYESVEDVRRRSEDFERVGEKRYSRCVLWKNGCNERRDGIGVFAAIGDTRGRTLFRRIVLPTDARGG